MPLVSVIIPAFNAERTILSTVHSIQQQTISDFELVVINDGSTDKTLEFLDSIDDSRLKVFSYPNGGLPTARNRGISKATGEFITFIDADDQWTPDKLASQLAALEQHPEAGVAYSWTTYIDENDQFLHTGDPLVYEGNVYPKLLIRNFISNGSNMLIRRQLVEEVGEFDPTLKSAEDWDYYIRLAAISHFRVIPKYQILYRRSSHSMTSKVDVMEKYLLAVIHKSFQSAPAELQFLKNQSLAVNYRFLTHLCMTHSPDSDDLKQASSKLYKAVLLYPKLLLDRDLQGLALKIGLKRLFPGVNFKSLVDKLAWRKQVNCNPPHAK